MKVKTIPAKPIFDVPLPRKVAAYCRVSTNQEIQHHSLEVQKDYFKKLIEEKLNWIFVDIYADEASGRNNLHMKEFQQMMVDCRTEDRLHNCQVHQQARSEYRAVFTGL